ncbi:MULTISPECIES: S53 family peptidase [Corallococcus]|uniref:S53 family peptidase n=1 Tax=Corallococcus TaxID=83461 RepID=UPI000EC9C901|nr:MULTISPECIES: S53 family serine peptidase [Corallococcus]NPD26085.1 kumamolisin [Corallococcus exiguus]RKH98732.1 kumamolisin [Corallococcus sp. AB038B]
MKRGYILTGVLLLAGWMGGCRDSDRLTSVGKPRPPGPTPVESTPTLPDSENSQPPPGRPPPEPEVVDPPPPDPEAEVLDPTPIPTTEGVPGPLPGVYTDKGEAPETDLIRGLVSFPIRDAAALEQRIADIYKPGGSRFRQYMTPAEWMAKHAPLEKDVNIVVDWLKSEGMQVPYVATNRLLVQFVGTVGQFNKAFGVKVIILERKSPQGGNDPHDVYGLTDTLKAPTFVQQRIHAVATLDLPAETGTLPGEFGQPSTEPPNPVSRGLTPQQVARAYNVDSLYEQGHQGQGMKLGVVIGASFRWKDVRAFWKMWGIEREDPKVIQTLEPPVTRYREGTLDVEWAAAMAPKAEVRVYMGPDARNTSILYTYNEAIARGEVSVITTSFAHREDSEPRAVQEAYSHSSTMAAALGITVAAASGDSAGVDMPGNSPYVTAVGGTQLKMNGMTVTGETAWYYSGSGITRTFATPEWQKGLVPMPAKRAVVDVALNADTGYWYTWLGVTTPNTGTSFSSPIFAGIMTVVNGARAEASKPQVGWLNSQLYTLPAVQQTFRDITVGVTDRQYEAGPGWDIPTGWGAPDAEGLLRTLP